MENFPRIGIFDSGIGGFSVLYHCLRLMPDATYFYYGDNARAPYGSRSREEIASFTREALIELEKCGVCAAILACNTATAACLEEMRAGFAFPILGVEPAIGPAARECARILVLATPYTASSMRLRRLISNYPQRQFTVFPAPALADAIERRFLHGASLELGRHLPQGGGWDGAVLGCTHYSLIRREISGTLGIPVYDGAEGTARHLLDIVKTGIIDHSHPLKNPNNCFTSNCNSFLKKEVIFLGSGQSFNKNLFVSNVCFNFI